MAAVTSRAPWLRRASIVAVVGLAIERVWTFVRAAPTEFDDAYMFLRYAHNLLAGFGLRWNRDQPPVYGATSLPHVLVVALLRRARPHLSDAAVLQASASAAAGLLVVALALTCASFARHPLWRRQPWIWAALLAPWLVYAEPFQFHALTGMDTMLAALANAALACAALWLADRPSRARAVATALVAYSAYLVRPDNAVYAALVPTLSLCLLGASAPPRARRGALLVFVVTLAALVALDLAVKQRLLGTPLPLGAYAKRPGYYAGFAGEFSWNPFLFLRVFLAGLWPFLVGLVVFTDRRSARVVVALLIPAAAGLSMFFGVNQIMGHLGRFYFPATPFVVVAAALALDSFCLGFVRHGVGDGGADPVSPPRRRMRVLALRCAGAALLLVGGGAGLTAAGARYQARATTQPLASLGGYLITAAQDLPELDSWQSAQQMARLARDAPAGTRLAMSEHGLPGAAAPDAVIIDVLGLHDRELARAGFSTSILWRRRPEVIWMPHPDHTQMVRDILDSDRFWDDYDFYPDAFSFGVAVCREGPRCSRLAALFRARWQASYPGFDLEDYRAGRDRAAP